jgi:tetratricopeptide (TPR) repeat protein
VKRFEAIVCLAAICLMGMVGCTREPVLPPPLPVAVAPAPPPPVFFETSDHALLEQALQGRTLPPGESLRLSDRMLTEGNPNFGDEATMARLELLLLKALQAEDRASRAGLLRNLGIIHYYQRQYKRARQELQASNELNPQDARTHFYLARLFAHQEQLYLRQGDKRKANSQAKLAKIELELARKLEPDNSFYQKSLKEILRQEQFK